MEESLTKGSWAYKTSTQPFFSEQPHRFEELENFLQVFPYKAIISNQFMILHMNFRENFSAMKSSLLSDLSKNPTAQAAKLLKRIDNLKLRSDFWCYLSSENVDTSSSSVLNAVTEYYSRFFNGELHFSAGSNQNLAIHFDNYENEDRFACCLSGLKIPVIRESPGESFSSPCVVIPIEAVKDFLSLTYKSSDDSFIQKLVNSLCSEIGFDKDNILFFLYPQNTKDIWGNIMKWLFLEDIFSLGEYILA